MTQRGGHDTVRARIGSFLRSPTGWIAAAAVALGIALRTRSLGFPTSFLWDEHHFVENARRYLEGADDANDHPPLGKLIMAGFMQLFGDTPEAWRAGAWLAGLLTIGCGGIAVARLFRNVEAGIVAGALIAADGFLIGYSRAALLDGYLALSVVLGLLLVTLPVNAATAMAGGVLAGAAMCVKFSGVALLLPLSVGLATSALSVRKRALYAALALGVAITTYLALFELGLAIAHEPATLAAVLQKTAELVRHHAELTDMKHPMTSGWVTWALPTRPLVMGHFETLESTRVLSSLGNLVIWWSSVAFAVTCVVLLVWHGIRPAALSPERLPEDARPSTRTFLATHGRAVLCTLSAAVGFLAPWVLSHRDSYINHFLPSYLALILLLSGFLGFVRQSRRLHVLVFLVLVLLVTAFYAPVWSLMPMSQDAVRARLFFPGWR
jgi:dolichyl-phosphate-mannose--protein O-mannosyl transferase